MSKKQEVVILGAGAVGCSIAYHLAKKGVRSIIIEKDAVGSRASGKAWAVVSYPPSLLAEGQDPDSFFGMPEGESAAQWQDLFWSAYHRMADLAMDIRERGKIDINFASNPATRIATSEESENAFRQLMDYFKKNGYYEYEWLGPDDLKKIFPGINPEIRGGLSVPQLQLDSFKYTLGLAQAAESMGAEIRNGDVIGFDLKGNKIAAVKLASGKNIEADAVVVAMGPWSGQAASWLGQEIPIHVTLDECLRIRVPNGFPLHSIYSDVSIIPKVDGDLILAFAEYTSAQHFFDAARRDDFDSSLTDMARNMNVEAAMNLLPDLLAEAELVEHRGDLTAYGPRPVFAKPLLGRFREWENGYIASRFGGQGIQMSVGAGEAMADLIVHSEPAFGVKKMFESLMPE